MRDDVLHDLTGAYVLDALDGDERRTFEEHLERCAACRREVAELRAVTASLAEAVEEPAPDHLRDHVLAAAHATPQAPASSGAAASDTHPAAGPDVVGLDERRAGGPSARRAARAPRGLRDRTVNLRGAALAAAASLVILVAGFGAVVSHLNERIVELETATAEVQRVLASGELVEVNLAGDPGTQARLVVSQATGEALLLAEGLPVLTEEQTLQLWLIDEEGAHSVGVFDPDEDGRALEVFVSDLEGIQAVGITVEPAGGSPQPTTEPFLLGEV